jgi:hypothetical protein
MWSWVSGLGRNPELRRCHWTASYAEETGEGGEHVGSGVGGDIHSLGGIESSNAFVDGVYSCG